MKRKIGYPKTLQLLRRYGYNALTVMLRDYGPFTYVEHVDGKFGTRVHRQPAGVIIYAAFLWEKFRNLH